MFIPPTKNPHVETLTRNMMVSGCGDFGRGLAHKDYIFMNEVNILIKETPEISLAPSVIQRHSKKSAIYEQGRLGGL